MRTGIILALCLVCQAGFASAAEQESPAVATQRLQQQEMTKAISCEYWIERESRLMLDSIRNNEMLQGIPGIVERWKLCVTRYGSPAGSS